jgi:hypothetical protein
MNISLKRKNSEESSTSKLRFLESLKSLEQTPPKKCVPKKKLEVIKNKKPGELFEMIFEKKGVDSSSGVKVSKKNKKKLIIETFEGSDSQNNIKKPSLKEVFLKLSGIPEAKVEYLDCNQTEDGPINLIEPLEIKQDQANPKDVVDPFCCTPQSQIIKIPESYKRQKLIKFKQRIEF